MQKKILASAMVVGALAGCADQESNPLIFAQSITYGVSASPSPAAAGVADFTVGFKQANLAIVPTIIPGDINADNEDSRKIVSHGSAEEDTQDALSVFGSFSGDTQLNNAKIGVFFATGVAAQNLSLGFRCATSGNAPADCK